MRDSSTALRFARNDKMKKRHFADAKITLSRNPTAMESNNRTLMFRYRLILGLFILGLVLSGLTALPLHAELSVLARSFGISDPSFYANLQGMRRWIGFVYFGLDQTYRQFPFFGYATDWLAFGHFVIAAFFILPLTNPIRYRAVLQIGLAACAGVVVLALVSGPIRGIPFF